MARAPADAAPDLRRILWYGAVAIVSVRRRPARFLAVAAAVFTAALIALALLPPSYEVRCRIVVRNPPAVAPDLDARPDAPHRAAARLLEGDDALRVIVRSAGLADSWQRRAPALLRWGERSGAGRRDPAEVEDLLTGRLERRLTVNVDDAGVVEIRARWFDPQTAVELARAAEHVYVGLWQHLEVSAVSTVVGILEGRADAARAEVERRVSATRGSSAPARDLLRVPVRGDAPRTERARVEAGERAAPPAEVAVPPPGAIPREVRSTLDVDTLLRMRALRLSLPLGEPASPARRWDPEREDPDALRARDEPEALGDPGFGRRDRLLEGARSGLAGAEAAYAGLLERVESGRIELDLARASFERRYLEVVPPVAPREPIWPDAGGVLLAAALDALVLALAATTVADLRARRREEAEGDGAAEPGAR
jgi:hypothetical protein